MEARHQHGPGEEREHGVTRRARDEGCRTHQGDERGDAQAKLDAAEALLLKVTENYVNACSADPITGGAFSEETDRRLFATAQQACMMAWDALEIIFTTAGTSIGTRDSMLARLYRDASVQKTHFVMQNSRTAVNAARLHFGLPSLTPF